MICHAENLLKISDLVIKTKHLLSEMFKFIMKDHFPFAYKLFFDQDLRRENFCFVINLSHI